MTWTNAFDLGACTVSVQHGADTIFSGVLAKAQTSSQFDGYLSGEKLTVSITSGGAAQLNWASGAGPSDNYTLTIAPAYDISTLDARALSLSIPSGISGGAYGANCYFNADADAIALTDLGDGVWTPDPASSDSLTGQPPNDIIAVWMGTAV